MYGRGRGPKDNCPSIPLTPLIGKKNHSGTTSEEEERGATNVVEVEVFTAPSAEAQHPEEGQEEGTTSAPGVEVPAPLVEDAPAPGSGIKAIPAQGVEAQATSAKVAPAPGNEDHVIPDQGAEAAITSTEVATASERNGEGSAGAETQEMKSSECEGDMKPTAQRALAAPAAGVPSTRFRLIVERTRVPHGQAMAVLCEGLFGPDPVLMSSAVFPTWELDFLVPITELPVQYRESSSYHMFSFSFFMLYCLPWLGMRHFLSSALLFSSGLLMNSVSSLQSCSPVTCHLCALTQPCKY